MPDLLFYEERPIPRHAPKSVVRGKTRVPVKISVHKIQAA